MTDMAIYDRANNYMNNRLCSWVEWCETLLSYRKVGGLHFIRVGRFGASLYRARAQ